MKVVINKCYGGFGLSPKALKRYAELKGRSCFFFKSELKKGKGISESRLVPITEKGAEKAFVVFAFDTDKVPTKPSNGWWKAHQIEVGKRNDPALVQVVEELGPDRMTGASGQHAELQVVEIPDGIDYEIDEYDGIEHIAERHRTWS